jgi:hypothetical protein
MQSHTEQARTGRGIHGRTKVAGPPCPTLTAVWGVARPQGGRPAAVFFLLGYPFPYGPDTESRKVSKFKPTVLSKLSSSSSFSALELMTDSFEDVETRLSAPVVQFYYLSSIPFLFYINKVFLIFVVTE